jgi:hypothetical protein
MGKRLGLLALTLVLTAGVARAGGKADGEYCPPAASKSSGKKQKASNLQSAKASAEAGSSESSTAGENSAGESKKSGSCCMKK